MAAAAAARAWRSALALSALWALGACTVSQHLVLRGDCSGETTIAIDFSADLVALVQDLADLPGVARPESGVINLRPIRNRLGERPGVTVRRVEAPAEDRVELELAFVDVRAVLPNADGAADVAVVTVEETAEGTRVRLHFDLDNYPQLAEVFPLLDDPVIRSMGPEENAGLTAEDYLSLMAFILGPDGPQAISDSLVTTRVTVDREVVAQRGGRVEGGAVVFEVPLLDLLLLNEPFSREIVVAAASCPPPAGAGPEAPAGFAAAGEAGSIILRWDDPGDATITAYEFRLRHPADRRWREWQPIDGSTHLTTAHALPGLTAGVEYRVQLRALNSAGAGEPGEAAATP